MTQTEKPSRNLFSRFPGMIGRVPWMPLADLPTPVQRLEKLGAQLGVTEFWIKRDDLDSTIYSGNKPRKFEFIFADAKQKGRSEVVTLGSAGSNHGAATCLFCRKLGFQPILALTPQPVLSYVRQNILVNCFQQAKIVLAGNMVTCVLKIIGMYLRCYVTGKTPPYFMFFGGSSVLGNIGFVEAGLELAAQIQAGALPMPKYLFVTTGSCGTHAGLLVGLRLAGLPIEVIGVRIVPKIVTNRYVVAWHANRTVRCLRRLDPSFPVMRFRAAEINLLDDFYGGEYGRPTSEGKAAIRLLQETEGMKLDPTYTGKTFAGILDFINRRHITHEPILFWQTLNGVSLDDCSSKASPEALPAQLRRYFKEPLYDPDL